MTVKRKEQGRTRNKRVLKDMKIPVYLLCRKLWGDDLMLGAVSTIEAHGKDNYTLIVEVNRKIQLEDLKQ